MSWTEKQFEAAQIAQRVTGVFSLIGSSFIITTFLVWPAFRKPINRLLFYATFGNILAAISQIISRGGIDAGQDSVLCQAQAFIIQQWMPADPLWSFCMAFNVYLTFYKTYSSAQLRKQEWKYFIICYGLPTIPNLTMFFIRTEARGRIYGPATLWCSITPQWQFLRIACFYGPVWLVIIATLGIFFMVGRDIFLADRQLNRYVLPSVRDNRLSTMPIRKVTTVDIQREDAVPLEEGSISRQNSQSDSGRVSSTTTRAYYEGKSANPSVATILPPTPTTPIILEPHTNQAARSYLRCSILFFLAMVITWLPSSINRLYTLANPNTSNYALNFVSATVLPLQGFWNFLVYLSTSHAICADLYNTHIMAPIRIRRRRQAMTESSGIWGLPFLGRSNAGRARLGSTSEASVQMPRTSWAGGGPFGYGRGRI